jgi:hypothetical protein
VILQPIALIQGPAIFAGLFVSRQLFSTSAVIFDKNRDKFHPTASQILNAMSPGDYPGTAVRRPSAAFLWSP